MFQASDIYTGSGAVKFYNSWTPTVAKFDTSSFYNWEQDNMPLYDLEERTYELWEQAGFPTSSLNGFALTVSADAPTASLQANSNIFTSVSACIAAIPRVLRFPVLIEVANFGDLGTLELNDIEMVENGSIEIINRNYGRFYSASSQVTGVTAFENYSLINSVSSADLSSTMAATKSVNLSALVYSSAGDIRLSATNVVVLPEPSLRRGHLTAALGLTAFRSGVQNIFTTTPYDTSLSSAGGDTTVSGYDIVPLNKTDLTTRMFRAQAAAGQQVVGSFYGNKFTSIKVKNCNGPVYIRNFIADGGAQPHSKAVGILVENSNVVLENCTATRFEEAGFGVFNSKVTLSRSAFAWRNYKVVSALVREARSKAAGFKFVNSEITFSGSLTSDTQAVERDFVICAARNTNGILMQNSVLIGGLDRSSVTDEQTKSHIQLELNSDAGLLAFNSHINVKGLLDLYGNKVGTDLQASQLEVNELSVDSSNKAGVFASNSKVTYGAWLTSGTEIAANRFQTDLSANAQAIVLDSNSVFGFNTTVNLPDYIGSLVVRDSHGFAFEANTAMPAIEARSGSRADLIHPFIQRDSLISTPENMVGYGVALAAKNGSNIECFGSVNHPTILLGPGVTERSYFLCGAFADDGSEIGFHGPTTILNFGIDALADNSSELVFSPANKGSAGAIDSETYALSNVGNHTSVELHSLRACLVADHNSTITMENLGHYARYWKNSANGLIAFGIGDDQIGAINTSSLCGQGSMQFYPNANDYGIMSVSGTAEEGASVVGSLTPVSKMTVGNCTNYLLANNDASGASIDWGNIELITSGGTCVRALNNSNVNTTNVHFPIGSTSGPTDGIYYDINGNDCSRLMIWNIADESKLNAAYCSVSAMYPLDVGYHGPSALYPSSLDGTSLTKVIARGAPAGTPDTGSLSILDSFGAGSAVWLIPSGVGVNDPFNRYFPYQASNAGLAGLLTQAGMAVSSNDLYQYGGNGTYNNQGVFRLYFSPHSSAKFLAVNASGFFTGNGPANFSGITNVAYQLFSQGYNPSGNCSALVPSTGQLSSLYPNLLKNSQDSDGDGVPNKLVMSGFYYCSEFLADNPSQCMLDESASNLFANAKNASYGRSGRPRRVTIYRASISDSAGESKEGGDHATGFKSSNIFDLRRYS